MSADARQLHLERVNAALTAELREARGLVELAFAEGYGAFVIGCDSHTAWEASITRRQLYAEPENTL